MKKELISPLLTILAMILLIISRVIDAKKVDWIAYAAIAIIIACIIVIFNSINRTK
ncbi:hypothetical protein [Winogradskyella sp. A2]|uniref:hypothetical protein n=1 Tax=Winogradskyella sp. A2 TaxID=3366944 RepID=UPI00398C773F